MTERESLTYRGKLVRDGDGISATVRCPWGFSLIITGTRTEGGYDLTVISGPVPEEFRIPLIDDDTTPIRHVSETSVISE